MATISIKKVTLNEILFIFRCRLKINQKTMAILLGLNRTLLSNMELGDLATRLPEEFKEIELADVEKCILLRRRAKLTHTQLSGKMGISRTWLCLMEVGNKNPARLIEYWSS